MGDGSGDGVAAFVAEVNQCRLDGCGWVDLDDVVRGDSGDETGGEGQGVGVDVDGGIDDDVTVDGGEAAGLVERRRVRDIEGGGRYGCVGDNRLGEVPRLD